MKSRLLQIAVILFSINGCAPTSSMYIHESSLDTDPNMIKIHAERPSSLVSGNNAILLADAGDGVEHNAVIATSPDGSLVYYVGPGEVYSSSIYGNKPEIGAFSTLCGLKEVNPD